MAKFIVEIDTDSEFDLNNLSEALHYGFTETRGWNVNDWGLTYRVTETN